MTDLVFTPLDEVGLSTLRSWFSDPELRHRFEYPTDTWFDYVSNRPNVRAWMIREDDLPVGQFQLDIETDQTGYIGFYVKPELRNQGYGKWMLRNFLARPEVGSLDRIVATADVDNLASQHCLVGAGFTLERGEPDEEGFLHYVYNVTKATAS